MEEIQKTINDDINPMLNLHGGSCTAMSFEKGELYIELLGGCAGCPSSKITLMNLIIPLLKEKHENILDIFLIED